MRGIGLAAAFVAAGWAVQAGAQPAAPFIEKPAIGYAAVKAMANACEGLAVKNGWQVTVAILDEGGHLLYFSRMDGADFNNGDLAQSKALTALVDGRQSAVTAARIKAGETNVLSYPHYVAAAGGYPEIVKGQKIGAFGVSGVIRQPQADACAYAAYAAYAAVGLKVPPVWKRTDRH
jgi:uncharacterized protein GlcG (DUF336 family)